MFRAQNSDKHHCTFVSNQRKLQICNTMSVFDLQGFSATLSAESVLYWCGFSLGLLQNTSKQVRKESCLGSDSFRARNLGSARKTSMSGNVAKPPISASVGSTLNARTPRRCGCLKIPTGKMSRVWKT